MDIDGHHPVTRRWRGRCGLVAAHRKGHSVVYPVGLVGDAWPRAASARALHPRPGRLSVRGEQSLDRQPQHPLPHGRGRHLGMAGRAHRFPRTAGDAGFVEGNQYADQGVLLPAPAAVDGHDRRLRLARYVPVLRFLGAIARAYGYRHRHVRPRPRAAGGDQVFPLHLPALGALSRRDSVALCQDRQLRLRRSSTGSGVGQPRSHAAGSLMGGTCVPGRLRGKGPSLSASWMVGRCDQRSSDRLRHGRRRQARSLFHPAL